MTSGGARAGAGRKAVTDSEQLTIRVKKNTKRKLRAEAKRTQPGRKRLELGKVIDDLATALPD